MHIKVIGSTKEGYIANKDEMMRFGGHSAGICYMPDEYETIVNESANITEKRIERTINSGHHSVYDHTTINLLFIDIPKIIAMILNNEKDYSTSEKSARYTKMKLTPEEQTKYNKWFDIFYKRIKENYADIPDVKAKKLAQENARYLTSVFTPTTMEYKVSLRQLNYIISMTDKFIKTANEDTTLLIGRFNKKLKQHLNEFIQIIENLDYIIPNLDCTSKNRELSIFSKRKRQEEFGENYSTNYEVSFACLAQLQRHRTLSYEFTICENPKYFIPLILKEEDINEWITDISENTEDFPQGMLIEINERGTIENFTLKCYERLCYEAQLEIMINTCDTIDKYIKENNNNDIDKMLNLLVKKSRCNMPGFKCTNPCKFGKNQNTRKI